MDSSASVNLSPTRAPCPCLPFPPCALCPCCCPLQGYIQANIIQRGLKLQAVSSGQCLFHPIQKSLKALSIVDFTPKGYDRKRVSMKLSCKISHRATFLRTLNHSHACAGKALNGDPIPPNLMLFLSQLSLIMATWLSLGACSAIDLKNSNIKICFCCERCLAVIWHCHLYRHTRQPG